MIVGSGAGGAVAAATLAEAGLDVLVLEAGGHYDRDSYPTDHLEAIAELYRDAGLTIADGRPPIPVPVAKVVGGTTVINSGTCFRAPDPVLERLAARSGSPGPATSTDDYAEAERTLQVTQLDPETMGRNGQLAMEGAAAIGASGAPISRNAGSCDQCSSCPFGCEIDAKRACTSPTCRARSRPVRGSGPGSRSSASWSRTAARSGSRRPPRRRRRAAAPSRCAPAAR